jgi:hypothetical protein
LKKILERAAILRPQHRELFDCQVGKIERLQKAMGRFSNKILDDFFSFPEMSHLVLHYLSKAKKQKYEKYYSKLRKIA